MDPRIRPTTSQSQAPTVRWLDHEESRYTLKFPIMRRAALYVRTRSTSPRKPPAFLTVGRLPCRSRAPRLGGRGRVRGQRRVRVLRQGPGPRRSRQPHRTSVRPFGYENDHVTVRESEAEIIRTVVDRFLAGEPSAAVAFPSACLTAPTGWLWQCLGVPT